MWLSCVSILHSVVSLSSDPVRRCSDRSSIVSMLRFVTSLSHFHAALPNAFSIAVLSLFSIAARAPFSLFDQVLTSLSSVM